MKIKRALISVWNKEGVVELAKFLVNNDVEIISTGGTKKILEEAGLDVLCISDITGADSIMDGRVKTLHPKIFGGILADRDNKSHIMDLEDLGGMLIDLVVVNFYPFVKEAVLKKLDFKKAIEFIDIGGPSMARAAAKNYHSVVSLCNPSNYSKFMEIYDINSGDISIEYRKQLASNVFAMTMAYESSIYKYFIDDNDPMPEFISLQLEKTANLRYGENPHQCAAFYVSNGNNLNWEQHQGKTLSYNNYADMETAINIVLEFPKIACVIIKHANPCGFGLGKNLKEAYTRAVSTDPISYFGGIVGFNVEVNSDVAAELIKPFLECIIAPSFSDNALEILKKKKNLRLISTKNLTMNDKCIIKSVAGGYLYQERDLHHDNLTDFDIVTTNKPNELESLAIQLGWKIVKYVKSNAIVFTDSRQLLGVGAGQMSRIDSVKIAIQKMVDSGLNLDGVVMASDAFFPFSDCVEIAAAAGITAIIQPGGSIKDEEVIKRANELGLSMMFTKTRHFLH